MRTTTTTPRRRAAMRRIGAAILAIGAALAAGGSAAAAGKGGGPTTSTSSLELVLLDSTDGQPHWGQHVTFDVETTATDRPYVSLECLQGGTTVFAGTAGFYPGYPWPSTQIFPLRSSYWTSGSADCVATAYYAAGRNKFPTLATVRFTVQA